jgi:hypothetical protein
MAKIGLVTFSNSYDNYGQVMQALATQEYLKNRGHQVYLMREDISWHEKFNQNLRQLVKKAIFIILGYKRVKNLANERLKLSFRLIMEEFEEKRHPRFFEEFRQHHFDIFNNSDSTLNKLNVSVLCTGSDQIWTLANRFFFLRFGNPQMKRIAIAPSTGNRDIPKMDRSLISEWLQSYSFVTTREKSGADMCKSLGYHNVCKILDPSFLLTADYYNKFASQNKEIDPYIFVYLLDAESPVQYDEIQEFAKANNLIIKYVTGGRRYDDKNSQIFATVEEWLCLLSNADYVLTNSFHGMAFSIIFRKKFLVLPLTGGSKMTNERIYNVTSELGLEKRIFSGDLQDLFNTIDYSIAEKRIKENKIILDNLMIDNGM